MAKTHLDKILLLQKRAVHLMNFAKFSDHAIPLFISSNILPLPLLYFKLSSTLMPDVYNKVIPSNISDLFTPTQDIHHYNTRFSSTDNFYINYSWLNHHKNSFPSIGVKIWNSIPEDLRKLPKQIFLKQDSYVDIHMLINEMKKIKN